MQAADMRDDMQIFVRVIRRLTCDMSSMDLGQDPTTRMPIESESVPWRNRARSLGLPASSDQFSTYEITMGLGGRCWYTLGPPIWSSSSLFGRGTVVWRMSNSSGKVIVLKNSRRNSNRLSESQIYEPIRGNHFGVVNYDFGYDAALPGNAGRVVNVAHLRGYVSSAACSPILHRLLMKTVGRPVWEYISELELLKGVRAALLGMY